MCVWRAAEEFSSAVCQNFIEYYISLLQKDSV